MLIPGVTTGAKAGSTLQETHVLRDWSAKSVSFPHPVNPLDVASERSKCPVQGIHVGILPELFDFATKNDLEQVTYTWRQEFDKMTTIG